MINHFGVSGILVHLVQLLFPEYKQHHHQAQYLLPPLVVALTHADAG
jgi:hypothetical protein